MNWTGIFTWIKNAANSIFKFTFKNLTNFLLVLFGVLCIIFFIKMKYNEHKYQNTIHKQTEEITEYRNKNNELYNASAVYITDISNLKKTNEELYQEVKKLKDNPLIVTKIITKTKIDSIQVISEVYIDTTKKEYHFNLNYADDWCSLNGFSNMSLETNTATTLFENISFRDEIFMDIIEENDGLYLISRSSNPYSSINNQESVMLSPEKIKSLKSRFNKRWGISTGVGISAGIKDGDVILIPAIQLTFGYQLLSF